MKNPYTKYKFWKNLEKHIQIIWTSIHERPTL